MGCLKRLLVGCLFFTLAGVSFLAFTVGAIFNTMSADARQARATPVKTLAEAISGEGPAWVKVRVEPATEQEILLSGETPVVWLSFRGRELVTQEIRRGGAWRMRSTWVSRSGEAQVVPVLLKADHAVLKISEWTGIEVRPDLWQRRRLEKYVSAESDALNQDEREWDPASVPVPQVGSHPGVPITTAGVVLKREGEEVFVPAGTDAWLLSRFEKGFPQVYIRDRVYLTGLGPERFAQELAPLYGDFAPWHWIFAVLSALFGLLFLRSLLKTS